MVIATPNMPMMASMDRVDFSSIAQQGLRVVATTSQFTVVKCLDEYVLILTIHVGE